jgi:hypothetical protein
MRFNPWLIPPLLVVLGVVALIVQARRVPERADWQAAVDAIRADLKPGDGVTITPSWAGEGRLFLHDLPAFLIADGEAPDLGRHERVWIIGAFGHDAADLGLTATERRDFGPLTLEAVPVKAPKVLHDLRADLDKTTVTRAKGNRVTACDFWDGRAWYCGVRRDHQKIRDCLARPTKRRFRDRRRDPRCGLPEWFSGRGRYTVARGDQPVGRDIRVIGDFPRDCVWFTPPPRGATRYIEWPVEATSGQLVLRYGFTDHVITDHPPQVYKEVLTKPAQLQIRRGNETIGQVTVDPKRGWFTQQFPVSGEGPITLSVKGESDVNAHLCVELTVREGS